MDPEKLNDLLAKYAANDCTNEELIALEKWYNEYSFAKDKLDLDQIKKSTDNVWNRLNVDETVVPFIQKRSYPWIKYVAAAILLISASIAFITYNTNIQPVHTVTNNDLEAGSNRAILTLSDGSNIILDSTLNTEKLREGITNPTRGLLAFDATQNITPSASNRIYVPKGGEYKVILSDGTKVWLNSDTELRFPSGFAENSREVYLEGEAYFEVTKSGKPFRVISNKQTIEVLGTTFNVKNYKDEKTATTTLLEGKVKVYRAKEFKLLLPGQQTEITDKDITLIENADTELAVAWKNGKIEFKNTDIPTMLTTLGRWYNAEIVYENAVPNRTFTGSIPRSSNISSLLKILKEMDINLEIEGQKIIVKK